MKKALVLGLAAIITGGVARADFSVSTDITFATDYIFRGIKLSDNTLHPSIEFAKDDFYAGYWGAFPINNIASKGFIDEYDFYAGWSTEISEGTSVDVGLTYYYYPQAKSTTEAYVGLTSDFNGITPGVYLYYDFTLEVLTVQANVGYSVPMESIGSTLDLSATFGYVEPDAGDSYSYYGVSAVVPFKLNENATITAGVHYASNSLDGADDNHLYGTLGLTIGF